MKLYVASNGMRIHVSPVRQKLHFAESARMMVLDGEVVYFPVLNKDGIVVPGAEDDYMLYAYCMTMDEIKRMEQVINATVALTYDPGMLNTSNLVAITEAVRGALEVAFK